MSALTSDVLIPYMIQAHCFRTRTYTGEVHTGRCSAGHGRLGFGLVHPDHPVPYLPCRIFCSFCRLVYDKKKIVRQAIDSEEQTLNHLHFTS